MTIVEVRIRFIMDHNVYFPMELCKPEKRENKLTGKVKNDKGLIIGYYDLFED